MKTIAQTGAWPCPQANYLIPNVTASPFYLHEIEYFQYNLSRRRIFFMNGASHSLHRFTIKNFFAAPFTDQRRNMLHHNQLLFHPEYFINGFRAKSGISTNISPSHGGFLSRNPTHNSGSGSYNVIIFINIIGGAAGGCYR